MKAGPISAILAAVLIVLFAPAPAVHAADAENGRRIADRWCASCHVVSGSGAATNRVGGTDAVPTLASIARDPARGPNWLRQWLTAPHPPMPNLNLSRTEIDDVVAYLETLSR
ncbi:cytochrome c [Azospirillum rugosum]|uniref:Mono/diheme cytochrome c family protein n=1 Tax=Azospirillum rugosum TaxID=416170 RepID=A0ABS4SFW2_9PROT|nr:cytochrome c [Azospirillum rugosum]MBP2291451.1 mono/diheme cytochrome c family protein [Azospirillum rugosum]MDQ0525239.1 mono/diheme cytochrome c family protein [Azospirillum rugosum]